MNSSIIIPSGCAVVILCHSDKKNGKRQSGSGPIAPLLKFFTEQQAHYIFLIEQPHPMPDVPIDCSLEVYKDGKLVATHISICFRPFYFISPERRIMKTYLRLKLRDLMASACLLLKIRSFYPDAGPVALFIGMESINALLGAFFRKVLRIRTVAYYTYDWAPERYANRWMSRAFRWLDRQACRFADVAWNVTDLIAEARRDILHYDMSQMATQLTVPVGVEYREKWVKPYAELKKFNVIFSGGHHFDNGAQLLPDIARFVQEKDSRVCFIITGSGPMTEELKDQVRKYGLSNVTFTGYIDGPENLDRLTCECLIGLAPYPDNGFSTKKYGDVIKIRTYFACGLVVVTTSVPPVAREIQKENLGIVTEIDARALANAIVKLCKDEKLLQTYRGNVIRKARGHSWTSIYTRTVNDSLSL